MNNSKLHHFIEKWSEWKHVYHSDNKDNIIFQNEKLLSNVVFTLKAFHMISKHLNGFEQIPETIMNPDSVWSRWLDPEKQTTVLRNYIKGNYVVSTKDGVVEDAFSVGDTKRFKTGCILLI